MPTPILLVEDNPGDVFLIRESLRQLGIEFELQTVDDGERAMQLIDSADSSVGTFPQLIILDLNVPKRSGDEILARIRQNSKLNNTAVIVVTSSDAAADRDRALQLGADAYFRKPFSLDQFLQLGNLIRQTLVTRQTQRSTFPTSV